MIKVLIADDHPLIRHGLRNVISHSEDMIVVDEACNSNEVLSKVNKDCDVIILDISMPGMSGLDVIKELKKDFPKITVLVLSAYSEEQYALRSLKSGASGYLTKEGAPKELIKAIKKVASGGKYISESIAEKLAFAIEDDSERAPHEKLSNREYEVMCMLATGKTGKDIAEELSLSEKTVGTYRARILEKMEVKNSAEIAYYALKHGLIE